MARTNPTRLDPPPLIMASTQPVDVVFQTGEIETIQPLDAGPAWSWNRDDGLRYVVALLPRGEP